MQSLKLFGRRPLRAYQTVKKLHQLGLPALSMLQSERAVRYGTNIKDYTKRLEGGPKKGAFEPVSANHTPNMRKRDST